MNNRPARQVRAKPASAKASRVRTHNWGPWQLDATACVLYARQPYRYTRYEIDLETCTTSAETLDRICQIADETWADDATLAGLIRALSDVLHPQGGLCPSCANKGQP